MPSDFSPTVSEPTTSQLAEARSWSLRDPLVAIPSPLRRPDSYPDSYDDATPMASSAQGYTSDPYSATRSTLTGALPTPSLPPPTAAAPTAGPSPTPGPLVAESAPPPIPMKIVISGGFGVGKTTFVGTISDITPLTTEAAMTGRAIGVDDRGQVSTKTTTTVAMDFGRVAVDQSLVLYLFGTPGQDRFGFMWDDLVTGGLGAIILVDSRRLQDCFAAIDYFEDRQIPFVIALNRFDGMLPHSIDSVRAALQLDPDIPVITTDARSRESVKETMLSLLDVVLVQAMARSGM